MGRPRLDLRMARLGVPVRVSATLSLATAIRLEALAPRLGLSRSAAVREAVEVRTLVWEQRALRQHRLHINRVLTEAEEWAPIDELLLRAKEFGEFER